MIIDIIKLMKIALNIIFAILYCSLVGHSFIVDPQTTFFLDQYNRTTIFHGVNVVYKTFPFYPDMENWSITDSLTEKDLYNLRRWGFNMIRLHIAWQGVEPTKNQYNYTYIQKVREVIRLCNKYDIYVLLDAHQDLFSKKFCGQGFPDWTVERKSFPKPLKIDMHFDQKGYPLREDCKKKPFAQFYLTYDVMELQQNFFTNKNGLLDSFIRMWMTVAAYMSQQPNLLGYELINQPTGSSIYRTPGDFISPGVSNDKYLLPAYKKLYQGIRKIDPNTIIFFQPSTFDPLGAGFSQSIGGDNELHKQVFSYHVYCPLVTPEGQPTQPKTCSVFDQLTIQVKQQNVKALKIGGFLTQFGALSNTLKSADQIIRITKAVNKKFHSWCYWQFKYYNDVTTMARPGQTESFYEQDGSLQQNKVKALGHPYVPFTCGKPINYDFDFKTETFIYQWVVGSCFNMPTQIFIGEAFYYIGGYEVQWKNCIGCSLEKLFAGYYKVVMSSKNKDKAVKIIIKPKKS